MVNFTLVHISGDGDGDDGDADDNVCITSLKLYVLKFSHR
jgi:hypothetical protein